MTLVQRRRRARALITFGALPVVVMLGVWSCTADNARFEHATTAVGLLIMTGTLLVAWWSSDELERQRLVTAGAISAALATAACALMLITQAYVLGFRADFETVAVLPAFLTLLIDMIMSIHANWHERRRIGLRLGKPEAGAP